VEISRVEAPRRVLKGTALIVDVIVNQTGYAGLRVPLVVEEAGRIVGSQDVTLPPNGEAATIKVRFKAADPGPRLFRVRIAPQAGEEVAQNNQRDVLIDVQDRREKILYIEGEPRFEPKFVRQATDKDESVQVVLLLRTAEATATSPDKFWRGGVDSPDELQDGFPATREALFGYRGLIIGSIEASAFTPDQQRMLEEFVDVRGGGLLALGGERALAEGGWVGTPLADALPFTLNPGAQKPIMPPLELVVRPTRVGESHPATQIADTEQAASEKWKALPPLTAVNAAPIADLKPGATALLTAADQRGQEQIVMAFQRYGRGKAVAMPVQDTWMWRMHGSMAVDDTTHQNFWQRLTRWLVDGVPDRVALTVAPERVQKGEPVTLIADVMNTDYRGINDARVTALVTAPSGRIDIVAMEWTVENDGEYRARYTPTEDGVHQIVVGGTAGPLDVGRGSASLRVAPSDAEYFGAGMRRSLLTRLAEETGGRFFPAADTASLVEAITYSGRGVTVVEERELWDMPVVLYLLLGLMGGEWLYRRARGLV
jgi:uncharacterized membrane protein